MDSFLKGKEMSDSLKLFTIDDAYIKMLRRYDSKVPIVTKANSTYSRPFLGVVLEVNGIPYFVPLTSPKPKHQRMKNMIDFMKIDNGIYGAINFNNMLPVTIDNVFEIDINSIKDYRYKNLLRNQLSWCNGNKATIRKKAQKLYQLSLSGKLPEKIKNRMCDFKQLEKALNIKKNTVKTLQSEVAEATEKMAKEKDVK